MKEIMNRKVPLCLQRYANVVQRTDHPKTRITNRNENKLTIHVVYFANLFVNPTYGHQLVKEQLFDVHRTGLLEKASLHIVLSMPPDHLLYDSLQTDIQEMFPSHYSFQFHISHENCHEYPGIHMVHSLAFQNTSSHHYILYFHSKSITRFQGQRESLEMALHSTVIARWKEVLQIFQHYPHIDKIGSTASEFGFIWWNYWWARASYIVRVESPVKTSRRHYYEDWLCRVPNDPTEWKKTDPLRQENAFQSGVYDHQVINCWGLSFLPHHQAGRSCNVKDAPTHLFRALGDT